MINSTK